MADTNGDSGLKTFFDKVGEAIKDAAALEVMTYSGDVSAYVIGTKEKVKDDSGKEVEKTTNINLNWDNFFENVATKTDGAIILVAATIIKVDGDTIQFVAANPNPGLLQAHLEAVAAAQEYRKGIVTAVANLIGLTK